MGLDAADMEELSIVLVTVVVVAAASTGIGTDTVSPARTTDESNNVAHKASASDTVKKRAFNMRHTLRRQQAVYQILHNRPFRAERTSTN
jgi:hypothetical protein